MADIELTSEERYKFEIITQVINHEIKPGYAAKLLGISTRQIRRLKYAVLDEGEKAVVHRLKGKQSNNHPDETLKEKALKLIEEKYTDFQPAFAAEKLGEIDSIFINPQTLRRWMEKKGLWKIRKRKKPDYHAWRARKEYFGELEQFDGSYHYWFEDRFVDEEGNPVEACLLASIDDATGKITKACFAANEGVVAVFTFWKEYMEKLGKPLSIYLDKFSTYKINHKAAVDNFELITQFQRATKTLGIGLIFANSPQAKGRIERLFQTLQDRLVKEMRLEEINTPEEGNRFLELFIPRFNAQFAVTTEKEGDVHRALTEDNIKHLNRTFSVQSTRRINNDFTIQFKNQWYQLQELQKTTVRAKDIIVVEDWLDGTIHFSLKGFYLIYSILPEKPKKVKRNSIILTTHKLNWKPPANHPWRKPFKSQL